jgi:antitoxin VapB
MAVNIVSREAETLLGEISSATGKDIEEIVLGLVRQEAARLRRVREHELERRRRRIDEISLRAAAKIPPDAPSPDEIIGYDEWGLPR